MTSKERAYLMKLASGEPSIIQIGRAGVTPELTKNVEEALAARELIKLGVVQNCPYDAREMAQTLAERTRAQVVQIIGRKIVLYRESRDKKKKIEFPREKKG